MLFDPRLIRMFCVMAQELHFGNAAKRLFMSQPPLSQAIRQLEEELGVRLFERTTRSVRLTRAGQTFYDAMQHMQQQTQQIRDEVQAIAQGHQGVVRVGVTPSGIYSNFSRVLRYFASNYPDIDLDIVELSTEEMIEELRKGFLDVGLMRPLTAMPGIETRVVYREPLCLAMPVDHALTDRTQLDAEDLQNAKMVTYDPVRSPYFHRLVNQWLSDHEVSCHLVQAGILPTILALVDGGAGIAIVPSIFSRFRTFGLHYVPLVNGQHYLAELSVAWRETDSDTLVRFVVDILLSNQTLFADSAF
ncbi:LysR family transcriptional regulator [Orrella sp. 11846]|uniref:LysR family transcriptional regulator n=1 Tax=Orrella sp. 11846 TaxID=3409913 RepID=UPI003B5A545B